MLILFFIGVIIEFVANDRKVPLEAIELGVLFTSPVRQFLAWVRTTDATSKLKIHLSFVAGDQM